ncbi:MAG: hypothetical protein ACK58M_15245 [Acidobacteriota bacterium]|jgi:hypothetical protein|nr:hypothetical protein [Acidobacteriaceae bacterium]
MRILAVIFLAATLPLGASKTEPTRDEIEGIIQKFAAKESEFSKARELYTYRQTIRIQEFEGGGGQARGRFDLVSDIIFSPEGKRTERIVRAPSPTLQLVSLSPEDEQDLRSVQPFVLTTAELSKYQVDYLGKEKLDEIDCYVFAVKPKKLEPGQRYFQGQVWVDDLDLQIVKSYGRATGLLKKGNDQRFPKFETWREQIDGKYWFPFLTKADDVLQFDNGPVGLKMQVKYEDYKQFRATTTITFGDAVETPPATTPPAPKPPKP